MQGLCLEDLPIAGIGLVSGQFKVGKSNMLKQSLLTQDESLVLVMIQFGIHQGSLSVSQVLTSEHATHAEQHLPLS